MERGELNSTVTDEAGFPAACILIDRHRLRGGVKSLKRLPLREHCTAPREVRWASRQAAAGFLPIAAKRLPLR